MTWRHRLRAGSPYLLAAVLATGGAAHFVVPASYDAIIPEFLPMPRALTYASGVAELGCAALLVAPRTRRVGAWASAALLVAVFPANVQMALDAGAPTAASWVRPALTWVRLPLQVPLVAWAVSLARRDPPTGDEGR